MKTLTWVFNLVVITGAAAQTTSPSVQWATTRPAGQKGDRPVMPAAAKAVMARFVKALDRKDWDTALSNCTRKTHSCLSRYGSVEEFFSRFVPLKELQGEMSYRFWTYSQEGPGGDIVWLGCYVPLEKEPGGEQIDWEWWLEKRGERWLIDLPDVPVDRWREEEIDRLKRLKDKDEAAWKALEPKLKGLRTQLTAIQPEYRLGQPMLFKLELVNEGEDDLSYSPAQVAVNGSMFVKDEAGRLVPYTAGPYRTGNPTKPIKGKERVILFDSFDLAKQYDMSKPGKYTVQFSGHGLMIWNATGQHGGARQPFPSNTVEIDVKQ